MDTRFGRTGDNQQRKQRSPLAYIVGGVLALIALIVGMMFSPVTTVSTGHVGVVTSFGSVQPTVLNSGMHVIVPWYQVHSVYIGVNRVDDKLAAASSDKQVVTVDFALNYHITPQAATMIYRDLNNDEVNRIIMPAMVDTAKAVVSKYDTTQLIIQRDTVGMAIETALREKLKKFGIAVDTASLLNVDFSPEYNKAIEQAAAAQQRAIQAENEVKQATFDAQKGVVRAQAQVQIATAEAQANQILGKSLADNPTVLEKLKIEKWNGQYPTYVGGPVPFMQVK